MVDDQDEPAPKETTIADSLSVMPKVYRWTGRNLYCQSVSVSDSAVGMGGGGGSGFGFRVGDDFTTVTTSTCDTFGNSVLCRGGVGMVRDVELWTFGE